MRRYKCARKGNRQYEILPKILSFFENRQWKQKKFGNLAPVVCEKSIIKNCTQHDLLTAGGYPLLALSSNRIVSFHSI
jgi:hypothetical protein